jgi:hypothetical protein
MPPARLIGMTGMLGLKTIAVVVLAMTACAGCGDHPQPEGGSVSTPATPSDRPMSSNPPPMLEPPSGPPKSPTDQRRRDRVVGRVVSGGSGPCYGVQTDDGKLYAVHSTTAGELPVGTTVRVTIGPPASDVDCGAGQPVSGQRIDVVR